MSWTLTDKHYSYCLPHLQLSPLIGRRETIAVIGIINSYFPGIPALVIRPWHREVKMIPGGTVWGQRKHFLPLEFTQSGVSQSKTARVRALPVFLSPVLCTLVPSQAMDQAFNPLPFPRYPMADCIFQT